MPATIIKSFEEIKSDYHISDLYTERIGNIQYILDKIDDVENRHMIAEFLTTTDFMTAPASTKFHLHVLGGLSQHCIDVYNELRKISEAYHLSLDFIAKIALLHDVCKIGLYEGYVPTAYKNKGKLMWKTTPPDDLEIGHGSKSVVVCLLNGIKLTHKEIVCIYWHMGYYNSAYSYKAMENKINKTCYEHQLLQFADRIATHFEGLEE